MTREHLLENRKEPLFQKNKKNLPPI